MSSSSSDSYFDSSDDDFDDLLLFQTQRQKREYYFEYVVPRYSEVDFVEHFRVRRHLAEELAEKFKNSPFYNYQACGNGKILPLQHILIFLWFAGHEGACFRDVADRFNIAVSSLCMVIKRVTKFVSSLSVDVVKWPSSEERDEIESHFRNKGMPGAIGAIDGTHIRIDKPKEDPDSYINRKNFFSIHLQVVSDHKRRIRDLFVGFPGSVHDCRVFQTSTLSQTMEEKCRGFYIMGDSAYPCLEHLLTPYRDTEHLTQQERKFNEVLSKNRCVVEDCFGQLKGRFRQLYHLKLTEIADIVHFIRACCVLHNLAEDDNVVFEDDGGEQQLHAPEEEEEEAQDTDNIDNKTGVEMRDIIAAQLQI